MPAAPSETESNAEAGPSAPLAPDVGITIDPAVSLRVDVGWIETRLIELAAHLPRPLARLEVRLVDDAEMIRQHARHLDDPTTTDVLTFELSDEADGPIDAALILCVDEAARQSAERGHTVERELLLYVLHGLLHCAGHDDHDDEPCRRMHAEEDRLLTLIGVGPTFGAAGDDPKTETAR